MIGWENDQGAYFIKKLGDEVKGISDNIGDLSKLKTSDKTDIVSAINSLVTYVAELEAIVVGSKE